MGIDEERLGEGVLSVQEVSCQRPISKQHPTTLRRSHRDVAKRDVIRALCAFLLLLGMSSPTSADDAKAITAILLVARAELPDSNFRDSVVLVMNNIGPAPTASSSTGQQDLRVSRLFPDLERSRD